jgi:hypothetical protein
MATPHKTDEDTCAFRRSLIENPLLFHIKENFEWLSRDNDSDIVAKWEDEFVSGSNSHGANCIRSGVHHAVVSLLQTQALHAFNDACITYERLGVLSRPSMMPIVIQVPVSW